MYIFLSVKSNVALHTVFVHGLSTSGYLIVSMFIQISDLHFDYVNNKVHIGSELTRFLCETIQLNEMLFM